MFPSVTEEAIHLPCAPDPDMARVFFGDEKRLKLGRWSSRADGLRRKKAWGEEVGYYPLIKNVNIERPPHEH